MRKRTGKGGSPFDPILSGPSVGAPRPYHTSSQPATATPQPCQTTNSYVHRREDELDAVADPVAPPQLMDDMDDDEVSTARCYEW